MENEVLGYVKSKDSGKVLPYVDKEENGYKILFSFGDKTWTNWHNNRTFEEVDGPEAKDNINPDHYKVGGIETFDFIQAKLSQKALEGYLAGNIIKYITRYEHKNGVEDLKKANWYLGKMIESMERVSE